MAKVILLPKEDGYQTADKFILQAIMSKPKLFEDWTKREIKENLLVKFSMSTVARSIISLKKKGIIYTMPKFNDTRGLCGLVIEKKEDKIRELLSRYPSKDWEKGEDIPFEN